MPIVLHTNDDRNRQLEITFEKDAKSADIGTLTTRQWKQHADPISEQPEKTQSHDLTALRAAKDCSHLIGAANEYGTSARVDIVIQPAHDNTPPRMHVVVDAKAPVGFGDSDHTYVLLADEYAALVEYIRACKFPLIENESA